MGYKSNRFGTLTRVELDGGYWVDVAPLTKAEDDAAQEALTGSLEGPVSDLASLRARLNQRGYTDVLLTSAIKVWNLDDEDGHVLPITVDTIQGLADGDATKILAVVRKVTNPLATAATPAT